MSLHPRPWFISSLATLLLCGFSAHSEASSLRVGEADGGSVVWDGDSEVRTENIFPGTGITSEISFGDPTDLLVQITLENDADALVSPFPLRLILSAQTGFSDPAWLTLEEVRLISPELRPFDILDPATQDIDTRIVPFYADLIPINPLLWGLSAADQTALADVLAAFPTQTFSIGLGTRLGTSLDSGNPDVDAFATFEVRSATAPEPSTMIMLGVGLAASGWAQRRRRRGSRAAR